MRLQVCVSMPSIRKLLCRRCQVRGQEALHHCQEPPASGERLQRLSGSSVVFLPSSIEWMQRQCHLAEDSGLAGSQPLAGAGTWSCCYVLLFSKGFASFLSLENTYKDCRVPQKLLAAPRASHLSYQGLREQLGPLGLKGLR